LKINTQESGYKAINKPYFPAGSFWPLMVTSVEKEMVVLSSAPALQAQHLKAVPRYVGAPDLAFPAFYTRGIPPDLDIGDAHAAARIAGIIGVLRNAKRLGSAEMR
jgi:hypothetical protein